MFSPSTTGSNGRDNRGRFAGGNRCAKGNPQARRAARLRAELFRAVTPEDVAAVAAGLIAKAREGDTAAAKLLLDRLLGPPTALDILGRIEGLESRFVEPDDQEADNVD